MLEKETKIFEAKLSELVKTDSGKFVLIKEETIYGTYVSIADAFGSQISTKLSNSLIPGGC